MAQQQPQGGDKNTFGGSVTLGTQSVAPTDVFDMSVESELDTPDHCTLHLGASDTAVALVKKLQLTQPVEVKTVHVGDPATASSGSSTPTADNTVFKGEITGIEPLMAASGETRGHTLVHCYNGLHSLSRGKRSIAYSRLPDTITDQQILDDIVKRYDGIIKPPIDYGKGKPPPNIHYKHVYQHNQTDLEFIRLRAARIGYYVLVQDKTLKFQQRTSTASGLVLVLGKKREPKDSQSTNVQTTIAMNRFMPYVSTANQFSVVRVRSFKTAERVEIVCTYPQGSDSPLYGTGHTGSQVSAVIHKDAPVVRVDIPFDDETQGNALAKAIATERMLNYITAEGSAPGDPRLKAGLVVTVSTGVKHYDGKYILTYVRHWYRQKSHQPYTTDFRAQRDATND